ncbi:PhnD/SsuA/transferrin family substrate-binding protein [Tibeticola sediminis]|jgi:phosphonate transport system substrate-binding protein|nr:PhnD/SsuA/transferrin family substrate-binding protein [Tibeticola sediminis]
MMVDAPRRRCLALLSSALAAPWAQAAVPARDVLRVGLTSVILADQSAFLARWSRYLSERLDVDVRFVARESYQSVLDLLFGRQLDAAWICGYPYVRWQSELSLVAVPQYLGAPTYQAYLIRPASGGRRIEGWVDLRGKVLAYSDPLSNSGWLVAQSQLALAGLAARDLRRAFFAHGHRNVAEAVAARLADAGSIDGYVWDTMRAQHMTAARETEIVWRSAPFGFPPIVALREEMHPALGPLKAVLLAMPQDGEGRSLLEALNLSGFEAGEPALFESIRRLALSVPGSGVRA